MLKDQEQLTLLTTQRFEIQYIVDEISEVLKNSRSCSKTFEGTRPNRSPRINGISQVFDDYHTGTEAIMSLYQTFDRSGRLYGQDTLKIIDYQLEVNQDFNQMGTFKITFDRLENFGHNRTITREIPLQLAFNQEDQLINCSLSQESFSEVLWQPTLEATGQDSHNLEEGQLPMRPLRTQNYGPVVIGRSYTGAQLVVDGPIRLKAQSSTLPECTRKNEGSLVYLEEQDSYFYCHRLSWNNLKDGHIGLDQFRDISLNTTGERSTSLHANFCVLHRAQGQSGRTRCEVGPPQRQDTIDRDPGLWRVSIIPDPPQDQAQCLFRCYL